MRRLQQKGPTTESRVAFLESLWVGARSDLCKVRRLVHALAVPDVGSGKGGVLVLCGHLGFCWQGEGRTLF